VVRQRPWAFQQGFHPRKVKSSLLAKQNPDLLVRLVPMQSATSPCGPLVVEGNDAIRLFVSDVLA
jgi:hypothetical protein